MDKKGKPEVVNKDGMFVESIEITRKDTEPSLKEYNLEILRLLNIVLEFPHSLNFVSLIKKKVHHIYELIHINSLSHCILNQIDDKCLSSKLKLHQMLEFIASDLILIIENEVVEYVLKMHKFYEDHKGKIKDQGKYVGVLLGDITNRFQKLSDSDAVRMAKLVTVYELV
jgi:hypothetical protein